MLDNKKEIKTISDKHRTKHKLKSKIQAKIEKSQAKAKANLEHKILNENELLPEEFSTLEELKDLHLNRKTKVKPQLDDLIEWNTETFFGGSRVQCIALSNDSRFLISVTWDGIFTVFELEQLKMIFSFKDDEDKSKREFGPIVVSESCEYVLAAIDRDIKAFNLTNGKAIFWIKNFHNERITSLLISKNTLITGSLDHSIKIFDLLTHKELHQFVDPQQRSIQCLTFTNDQAWLISGLGDGSVKIFDFTTKKEIYHLSKIHKDTVRIVTVTYNDEYLITTSDNSIKMVSLKTKEELHHFEKVHRYSISALVISQDNKYIFSDSYPSIKIFDLETRKEIYSFEDIHKGINSMILSKDGRYLLSALDDCCIMVFNIQTRERVNLKNEPLESVFISKDNKYIVSGTKSGIKVYDFDARSKKPLLLDCGEETVCSLVISSRNKYLISGCEKSILIFDLALMKQIHQFPMHESSNYWRRPVDISNDERFIVATSSNNSIKIFDIEKFQEMRETFFESTVCLIYFSYDLSYLIVGLLGDSSIKVIDFKSHHLIFHFKPGRLGYFQSLAVSHDNKFMISLQFRGEKGRITTLDLDNFQVIYDLDVKGYVVKVSLTRDNRFIILTLNDSIKILDFWTGIELHCFENVHFGNRKISGYITTTCLSNDDKYVLSGSGGGDLQVIRLERRKKESFELEISNIDSEPCFLHLREDVQWAILGFPTGLLVTYDLLRKQEIYRVNLEGKMWYSKSSINSPYVFIPNQNIEEVQVFNLDTKKQEYSLKTIGEGTSCMLDVSKDSKFIAAFTERKCLIVFDFEKKKEKWKTKIEKGNYCFVAISKNNNYVILSTSQENGILFFDLQTGQHVRSFNTISGPIISIDDQNFLAGGIVKPIVIFDIETKQQSLVLENLTYDSPKLSDDGRYLFYSSSMIDLYTGIELQEFETTGLAIFSDNKSILNYYFLQETCFSHSDEVYVSSKKSIDSLFASGYDDFITSLFPLDPEILGRFFSLHQDMFIIPYHWTVLHLLAIFNPSIISHIPAYSQFQVPFLLDSYGKTPLHYVLVQKNRDFSIINIILKYIIDYVEDMTSEKGYEHQKICSSLSSCFYFIIAKISPNLTQKFLKICYPETRPQMDQTLPSFGFSEQKYIFSKIPTINPEILPKFEQEGDDRIVFRTNLIYLDYNPRSDDMLTTTHVLSEIKEATIFKIPLIENLIDHLWESTSIAMYLTALAYSALMIQISLYIGSGQESFLLEVNILILTVLFLISELIQAATLKNEYLDSIWNWLDLTQLLLTFGFIFTKLYDGKILGETWILSAVIIAGYLRWLSYLRLFATTRILIEIILAVMYDMIGFIAVIASILVGFSLIFLEFGRNEPDPQKYGFHFYTTFKLLFGDYDDSNYTLSQIILVSVLMCVLNVVLLNLLIAIIGDSFSKINEARDLVDAKTRLDMILEVIVVMRCIRPRPNSEKNYLIYRLPGLTDEKSLENREWEYRINRIEKSLMQNKKGEQMSIRNEVKTGKQVIEIKQEIAEQSNQVKENVQHHTKNLEDQLKKEIKENFEHTKQQNVQNAKIMEEQITLIKNEVKEVRENVGMQINRMQDDMQGLKQLINLVLTNLTEGASTRKADN